MENSFNVFEFRSMQIAGLAHKPELQSSEYFQVQKMRKVNLALIALHSIFQPPPPPPQLPPAPTTTTNPASFITPLPINCLLALELSFSIFSVVFPNPL